VKEQSQFDEVFQLLYATDRKIVMRAADAIEKITLKNQEYLKPHKRSLLNRLNKAEDKELKWHLALLIARFKLSEKELDKVWHMLTKWARDKKESKIVRVNSLQALFNLLPQKKELQQDLLHTLSVVKEENIPSINARIRKLNLITVDKK
jgi:hypothetical protein